MATLSTKMRPNSYFFKQNESIYIRASASDLDGSIEKIQFLINDELHHEDFEKPYEYNWDNVEIGTYEISAIAVDNENG